MLLLVRIIPARDYGRAAVVVGILTTMNTLNAHMFFEAALQLPEGEKPDWSLHWTFGFYLQAAMAILCQVVAGLCWLVPAYVPIAKLLHLAAFGVFFEAGNGLGATMLRRELDFRRLKVIAACGMFARLTATVAFGLAGGGAYAIVLGGNVIASLPFGVDLFLVRRWRPDPGWWRRFDRSRYADAIRFGLQRAAGSVVAGVRDGFEVGHPAGDARLQRHRPRQSRAGALRNDRRASGHRPGRHGLSIPAAREASPRAVRVAGHALSSSDVVHRDARARSSSAGTGRCCRTCCTATNGRRPIN